MLSFNIYEVIYFIGMGTFGALLYVIVNSKNWEDFSKFEYVKRMMLGPLVGFLYNCLYSEYNFPNTVMAIVAGYMGPHFTIGIIEFLKDRLMKKDE